MYRSHVLRALRMPLLLVAALALVWVGLMTFEHTSSHPAGLKATNAAAQNDAAKPKPAHKPDKPPKHCKDHHGKDDEHNKHCRPISDG